MIEGKTLGEFRTDSVIDIEDLFTQLYFHGFCKYLFIYQINVINTN